MKYSTGMNNVLNPAKSLTKGKKKRVRRFPVLSAGDRFFWLQVFPYLQWQASAYMSSRVFYWLPFFLSLASGNILPAHINGCLLFPRLPLFTCFPARVTLY